MKILITILLLLNNCYAHLPNPHAKQFPHAIEKQLDEYKEKSKAS